MQAKFYYKNDKAPTPNKPTHIGITAILINTDGEILMEKRADSYRWALIGGGLKVDESIDQCFCREVHEETGLIAEAPPKYAIYDDPSRIVAYPDGNVVRIVTIVYLARVLEDNLTISDESLELRYFAPNEIRNTDIVETHRHIIDDYLLDSISVGESRKRD